MGGFDNLRIHEEPLRLLVDKAGVALDLSQLSDGERSFLALTCDLGRRLALASPLLLNPLSGAGVVLIDELELHLHPKWQREVSEKLRTTFPNIQFIATTHSPFVIQAMRPGEIINLDPDEFEEYADKSIEDIGENVMGVEVPQKSERYRQMMEVAEAYFRLLRDSGPTAGIVLAEYFWPDTYNTMRAFEYVRGGMIQPEAALAPSLAAKAQATIRLVGLDRHPGNVRRRPTSADLRWLRRQQAWK